MKRILTLMFGLGFHVAIGQNSLQLGDDCNPRLNNQEIVYFDSLFSYEKYDFHNKTVAFASPNVLRVLGILPMPPGFNSQLLPITKKEYFQEVNQDVQGKKCSKLLILTDSLKAVTKGFDAIVLLIPDKKLKKVSSKTTENTAIVLGYRSLNYPDNLNSVGNDNTDALTDEEVKFLTRIYQHYRPEFDFRNKKIIIVDYYSKRIEKKRDYINRIKKHLENDFLYPTDELIILTEGERKVIGGIDAVILLPEKMYNRSELIEIVKKNTTQQR